MIEITLYTRQDCHLCDELKAAILEYENDIPYKLVEVDIDQNPALKKQYNEQIPIIVIGPYTLRAPIDRRDLEVTLRAAQQRAAQIADIEEGIASGRIQVDIPWSRADQFSLWLSRNWLKAFNLFTLVYVGLPFLAPLLMHAGAPTPSYWIYRVYGVVCHQFAFRSWFMFGEQSVYPRSDAYIDELFSYEQATGLDPDDLWVARSYTGDENVGYKVALCQRDVAIYIGILSFGLIFGLTGRRLFGIPWYLWILFGILPIGFDGLSQLISQPPLSLIPIRESTPLLRTVTGFLFGFVTAWFGYPIAEESMRENREYLTAKLRRVSSRQQE
jgi:uncharacterized membrane protein/glutaredoxin